MSASEGPRLGIDEIRELVAPIARKHGVERMYLFGSRARGDNKEDSDYDFCISPGAISDLIELSCFLCDLKETLGRDVDYIYEGSMSKSFAEEVLRDRRLVFEA